MRLGAALALALAACGHGPSEPEGPLRAPDADPVDVTTAVVEAVALPEVLELTGFLAAPNEAMVPADVAGIVTEVRFKLGDRVRKGQVLAVLDTRTSAAQASASSAQASAQEAQLQAALADCARADKLLADGAMTEAQHQRATLGCEAQRQATRAAKAAADAASTAVERAQIRAPFDGVVGQKMVDVGVYVGGPQPIAVLFQEGPLKVRLNVPEAQAASVAPGAVVRVRPSALPGVELTGTVDAVGGGLRPYTRDLAVEATLDAADPRVRPGMFAQVELEGAAAERLAVPQGAVVAEGSLHRLFRVRDGRAYETVVRVGVARDGKVAILTDVAAGDVVVLDPPVDLADGRRVE